MPKKNTMKKGTQFKLLFAKDMSQFLRETDKAVQFPLLQSLYSLSQQKGP